MAVTTARRYPRRRYPPVAVSAARTPRRRARFRAPPPARARWRSPRATRNRPVRRGCHGERFCDRYGYVGSVDRRALGAARGTRFGSGAKNANDATAPACSWNAHSGAHAAFRNRSRNRRPESSSARQRRFGSAKKRLCFLVLGFEPFGVPAPEPFASVASLCSTRNASVVNARVSRRTADVPPANRGRVFETHRLLDQAHRSRSGVERGVASVTNPSPQTNSRSSRSAENGRTSPRGLPQDTREDLAGGRSRSRSPSPTPRSRPFGTTRGRLTQERGRVPPPFFCAVTSSVADAPTRGTRAQNKSHVFIGFVDTGRHGSIHRHAGKRSFLCRHQFRAAFGERDARDRLGVARQNLRRSLLRTVRIVRRRDHPPCPRRTPRTVRRESRRGRRSSRTRRRSLCAASRHLPSRRSLCCSRKRRTAKRNDGASLVALRFRIRLGIRLGRARVRGTRRPRIHARRPVARFLVSSRMFSKSSRNRVGIPTRFEPRRTSKLAHQPGAAFLPSPFFFSFVIPRIRRRVRRRERAGPRGSRGEVVARRETLLVNAGYSSTGPASSQVTTASGLGTRRLGRLSSSNGSERRAPAHGDGASDLEALDGLERQTRRV